MTGVVLPPGLPRLPANLGEERHGKLKAAQWYCLFAYVIPLVVFDLYLSDIRDISINSNRGKFFMNTAYLMQCTHILFARQITGAQINRFQSNYQKYCESVGKLFEGVKVQPNHHFSLHIPQQIRTWGPLVGVAEFAGERLIGFLQKLKTNNLIDQMNGTMMRRGCYLQRLLEKPQFHSMAREAVKDSLTKDRSQKVCLTSAMYNKIYEYIACQDSSVVHREACPVPFNSPGVLPGWAKPIRRKTVWSPK
ncbi:hypothetical protein VP01_6889g1 [Puccinia sorghi]|uniref:Uncharacterized protein n=1 Tax=Puccinia sorghi TaxID=27349 RepID=A0A0L6UEA5_9BASI|nr:hypothetical protein VP01_6889g1 [Puccinia sorghi]